MRKSIKWKLIKFAVIVLPIIVFYFWSFIGLGILALIAMPYLYITRKMVPQTQNDVNDDYDEDTDPINSISLSNFYHD